MRETMGPTGLVVGGVGSVPCSPLGKEEAVIGADAAGGIIFTPVPRALALLPCLGGSGISSRKETVGWSWSLAGSCLSGRTFQKVE